MNCEVIRLIREKKGFSQRALAEALGMTAAQLCKIEKGTSRPRRPTLERIAAALGTGVDELVSFDSSDGGTADYLPVRRACALYCGLRDKVRRMDEARDGAERRRRICRATTVPLVHGYLLQPHANEILARSLRDSLGVGTAAFADLVWTLEFANVRVYRLALPEDCPSAGWWRPDCERLTVALPEGESVERQTFRLAYELGAACLYRSTGNERLSETKWERRFLGAFAADFLMPASAIADMVGKTGIGPHDWDMRRLCLFKNHFGVSAETFVIRLDELGLIDHELRVALRRDLSDYYAKHPASKEPPPFRALPASTRAAVEEEG